MTVVRLAVTPSARARCSLSSRRRSVLVQITLSRPMTWVPRVERGWSGWASGCAWASPSGTVGTRVDSIRVCGGAAGVRLACLARSVRPGQGRRDPDPAPPDRRPPAPGQGAEAVVGRPGGAGRAGLAADRQPAPPAALDRLPANCAALACRPRAAALGLSAPFRRASQDQRVRAGAGAGDGPGQPGLEGPAHPQPAGPAW